MLQDVSGDQDECNWPFAIIPVLLNGQGPFPFGLEIGRGRTLLTEEIVRAIGIDPEGISEKLTLQGHGCTLDFPLLRLKSLALGVVELRDFDAMVWLATAIRERQESRSQSVSAPILNVRPLSQDEAVRFWKPEWMGIIGFDFLKSFNVTFDFPHKKLRLGSDAEA